MERRDFLASAAQETVKPAEICQFAPCRCPQCKKWEKENGRELQDSFQSITLTGFSTEWRAMHQILVGSRELGIICANIHSSIHCMAVTFSLSWFSFFPLAFSCIVLRGHFGSDNNSNWIATLNNSPEGLISHSEEHSLNLFKCHFVIQFHSAELWVSAFDCALSELFFLRRPFCCATGALRRTSGPF